MTQRIANILLTTARTHHVNIIYTHKYLMHSRKSSNTILTISDALTVPPGEYIHSYAILPNFHELQNFILLH